MRRLCTRLAVIAVAIVAIVPMGATAAHAEASIDGAGSTWSQIAIDQWRADVARQGLSINYQGVGSTSGRVFYYQNQVDFGVSEIPFTSAYRDASGTVSTNEVALAAHRPYAYLPIVAGGTSFMYHLDINGHRVNNLRLAPGTVAKIFTGAIKKWNDPAIAADNPQLHLPSIPIRPVVRSDGSGTTAQFTAFMASQTPDAWNAFCQRVGVNVNPCPSVSLWPDINAPSQQFSDGVAAFVAAPYNNGAITYVEYGYARQRGFPVASVLNKAGYYTQPSANAVAIALQGVKINADDTQNLEGVYTFADARAYPVSSYSYMIVPTTTAAPFTAAKGLTLSKFIVYFVCVGQQKAAQLGYSPLPKNLVQVAFDSMRKIPGHVAPPAIDKCDNPTINGTFVTGDAPPPLPSDRKGAAPPTTQPAAGNPLIPGSTDPSAPGGATQTGGAPASGSTGGTAVSGAGKHASANHQVAASDGGGTARSGTFAVASGPITAPSKRDPLSVLLYLAAGTFLIVAVFGPPALAIKLQRRKPT